MHRRAFLTATAAAASAVTLKAAYAATVTPFGATGVPGRSGEPLPLGPLSGAVYPDPHVESLKKPKGAFGASGFPAFAGTMAVERVATGFRWAEGPVYFPAGRYVLFSDIPNNRIMRYTEDDGHTSVFRQPSMNSNGNTIDREGRLITCEHDSRRVTRTEHDGSITVLMDKFNGKPLNAPNDVVVSADGAVWFTDPGFGIFGNYEGHKAEPELPANVYRLDPRTGQATVVFVPDGGGRPNGIALSPDEKKLYVIAMAFPGNRPAEIRVFDINGGRLSNGKVFANDFTRGNTDGMRIDMDGNVWCSMGNGDPAEDGVRCYAPTGELIGKIHLPETCANLTFGGKKKNRLFMTASTSVYSVYVETIGAMVP